MPKFYESADGSPEEIQISNDAYYFLTKKEPCLDEDNMEEVKELNERYKHGFSFTGEPIFVEDSDLVEVTIIPRILVEVCEAYTHYFCVINHWRVEYRYIENKSKIEMRYFNTKTYKSRDKQICDVVINGAKKPQFTTRGGSIYPLWSSKTHVIKTF